MLTGYRWYDAHGVKPLFPFGHGLSYAAFKYSAIGISGRVVHFTLSNEGRRWAAEVPQLYVRAPKTSNDGAASAFMQLRGFQHVGLKSGESRTISFTLTDRWLSYWNVASQQWTLATGEWSVLVGASSGDIRLLASLHV